MGVAQSTTTHDELRLAVVAADHLMADANSGDQDGRVEEKGKPWLCYLRQLSFLCVLERKDDGYTSASKVEG